MSYINFILETDADGIVLITWDMPDKSMNVIDQQVVEEWEKIIDQVAGDDAIKGAVVTSAKKSFGAGADLSMIQTMLADFNEMDAKSDDESAARLLFENASRLSNVLRKQETCGKPWVAAINGLALGGCLEITLACHGRVMVDDPKAKVGLPEVKVGLFPGAGGTQRVPRLIHTQEALQFLLQGRNFDSAKAKKLGLVTEVASADQLVSTAKKLILDGLSPVQPWDKKGFRLPGGQVYSPAGFQLFPPANAIYRRETYDNYPGARAIMKCVYEGLILPIDTALRVESRYFAQVLRTTEASMMIRSLFGSLQALNKGARRPMDVKPSNIKSVGVLGAGFMGAGIAYVTAKAGINVVLLDRDLEATKKGKSYSADLMDKAIGRRRATPQDKETILDLIKTTTDYADLEDCDLVVEAVFEDSEVKKTVTQQAEAHMKPSAIFASNTSTIPITALAKNSKRPKSFIGIHFFSPVDKMMLTEIIMAKRTGDKALAMALDYVRAINKTPIVVNDSRGFYVNRCVLRYMSEAYNMVIEGVPAPMIETVAKMAGMPIGPLSLNDETAIDLSHKILHQTIRDMGEKAVEPAHVELVDNLVENHGRLGRKNLKGFYDYPSKPKKKHLWPGLKDLYPQLDASQVNIDEIKNRFHATIALEAARCVEEGVVVDVREADIGSILGFGFAPFTGGAISYIDGMGSAAFVDMCKKLQKKYGKQFKPNKLLLQMAKENEKFYDRFDPFKDVKQAA